MLNQYINSDLLNLKDVIIDDVIHINDETHIIAHQLEKEIRICPRCGSTHCHVHDHRIQVIKDISAFGEFTYIHLDKRRYACQDCAKRFYEPNSILPKYYHCTSRLIANVVSGFQEPVSAKHIAREHNISTQTALRYFDKVQFHTKAIPTVISIDEFKGNADGQKYQSILTNPSTSSVIDILPNRFENKLIEYFNAFENRDKVEYFITDMNPHFLRVAQACFPKATVVVDKFHVIRQVTWAAEKIRKNEQNTLSAKFRKHFKRSKYLMYKNKKDLTPEEMNKLALMFEIAPRLAKGYRLYWSFIEAIYSENSTIGKEKLSHWVTDTESLELPEFKDALTAVHNWDKYILNAMDCSLSNGYTEGCNNRTKVLKRACYGIQRFDRLRNRIMYIASA